MNTKRLKTLADHLRTVNRRHFHLDNWKCGTTACAVGHACDIPEFREAGLRLASREAGLRLARCDELCSLIPVYGDNEEEIEDFGWGAVGRFFDLNDKQSAYLFDGYQYEDNARPADVADRIDQFIAAGGLVP